jgi:Major Facilitator Superfamily
MLVEDGDPPARIGILLAVAATGSVVASILMGLYADRFGRRSSLLLSAGLMGMAGVVFEVSESYPLLLAAAFVGTVSPSTNDNTPFSGVEQAILAQTCPPERHTVVFARYGMSALLAGRARRTRPLGGRFDRMEDLEERWHARLVTRRWTYPRRQPGRPPHLPADAGPAADGSRLPTWGYRRIRRAGRPRPSERRGPRCGGFTVRGVRPAHGDCWRMLGSKPALLHGISTPAGSSYSGADSVHGRRPDQRVIGVCGGSRELDVGIAEAGAAAVG